MGMAAPSQEIVDQWITVAEKVKPSDLMTDGQYVCENKLETKQQFKGAADNPEFAKTKYLLQCLQYQCQILNQRLAQASAKLRALPIEELTDFMHSLGYSPSEIQTAIDARKSPAKETPPVTCRNGSPQARMFVVDSCFTLPIRCYQK